MLAAFKRGRRTVVRHPPELDPTALSLPYFSGENAVSLIRSVTTKVMIAAAIR